VGYVPHGAAAASSHGLDLLPDYLSDRGPVFYVLAAVLGIALVAVALRLLGWLLVGRSRPSGGEAGPPESRLRQGEMPEWLRENDGAGPDDGAVAAAAPPLAAGETGPRIALAWGRRDFVEKTLLGIADSARESIFAENWARREGMLQGLDPRAKVVGLVGLVVVTSIAHRWQVLAALYALGIALGLLSRLPLGVMVRRVWLAVPLFAGAVTLPAALNVVTPGRPLLVLLRSPLIAVTAPGLAAAGVLTLRVGVAVSFVMLLTLTTPWNRLLYGLRGLLVPRAFLMVLAMTYRYLSVLLQSAADMFTSRRSRTVGRTAARDDRRFVGGAMGALFGKTIALADEVHAAMLSRGWTGEARALAPLRMRAADMIWLGAIGLAALAALGGELGAR
jgi:cobalt ECF transporter T component CbiQ